MEEKSEQGGGRVWWELRMGGGWPGVTCDIGGRPGQVRGATRMYSRGEDPRPRTRVGGVGVQDRSQHAQMLRDSGEQSGRVTGPGGRPGQGTLMGTWTLPLSKIRAVARGTGCGGDLGQSGEDGRVWMLSPADPLGVGVLGTTSGFHLWPPPNGSFSVFLCLVLPPQLSACGVEAGACLICLFFF